MHTFQQVFGDRADTSNIASGVASGTINILGAHTSYNHGFALAIATSRKTRVEVAASRDGRSHFHLVGGETVTCSADDDVPAGFAGSLFGCLLVLLERGFPVGPVCALVRSGVPLGAGLSGTAALQVAMMRALEELFTFHVDDLSLARLAHRVELEYAGVNCGFIDHMAATFADDSHIMVLDTRSLFYRFLPLPLGAEIVVLDSGIPSSFSTLHYLMRRGECEEACRRLGVPALRDVDDVATLFTLPPLLQRRAGHIVSENARAVEASVGVSPERLGELMNESHASLRDDYEVTDPSVDMLADLLRTNPHTFGARLAGGGAGGSCAALVEAGMVLDVAGDALSRYSERGGEGRLLLP